MLDVKKLPINHRLLAGNLDGEKLLLFVKEIFLNGLKFQLKFFDEMDLQRNIIFYSFFLLLIQIFRFLKLTFPSVKIQGHPIQKYFKWIAVIPRQGI